MNLPAIIRAHAAFTATHGMPPTHLFVDTFPRGSSGIVYGMLVVEVLDLPGEFAVGILFTIGDTD